MAAERYEGLTVEAVADAEADYLLGLLRRATRDLAIARAHEAFLEDQVAKLSALVAPDGNTAPEPPREQ